MHNNIQKPLAYVWLGGCWRIFKGWLAAWQAWPLCYSLLLAHSLLDSSLCGHLEAAPAVCLHVSHPTDGLDLGLVGSPLVPVLERAHLKHILVATVARVLVAHPAVWRSREKHTWTPKLCLCWPTAVCPFSFHLILMDRNVLRSTGDLNTGNTVLEAVRPQAWNILIAHLHLTTLEVWTFIQANLVILGIL